MAEIDPYAVLGVPRTATREEVARAYRALAKRHHPDAGAPPSPTMGRINEAWAILGSTARRAAWDEAHAVVRTPHWAAAPPRGPQRPERPAAPPPSRLDSGWAAFGVVAAVVVLVGATMIGLAAIAAPAAATEVFQDEALRFSYPVDWVAAPGDAGDDGHRVIVHLVTFGVTDDELCTSFAGPCTLEPDEVPAGEGSIVITLWDEGTPPVPDPVVNMPAGPDADAIIGGRPAAFEQRALDEDTTVYWWQLSPPGFPDRWIEITAVLGGVLDETGGLQGLDVLLNSIEFRE